jgi:hypothetical protein
MKNIRLLFLALLIILFGCGTTSDFSQVLEDIQENLDFGNVSTVIQIVGSLTKISSKNREIVHVAGALHPEKQYLRSEPNDFQRGEVEWKGGNLFFDKWDYNMKIKYINPL